MQENILIKLFKTVRNLKLDNKHNETTTKLKFMIEQIL